MKRMTMRLALAAATVLVTAGAAYAVPGVTNVVMTQRANSRIVDITYELTGEAAIVTLGIETNGVALPDSAVTRLTGDVCKTVATGSGQSDRLERGRGLAREPDPDREGDGDGVGHEHPSALHGGGRQRRGGHQLLPSDQLRQRGGSA